MWVATKDYLTELDAATGVPGLRVSGQKYGFSSIAAITAWGDQLWVLHRHPASVTELDARTGRLVRVVRGAKYGFKSPRASPWQAATSGWPIGTR